MIKLEEKDFIKGNKDNRCDALLLNEDCKEYIDSVLDKVYSLNLTKEEEKKLGLEVYRDNFNDSWRKVKFILESGDTVLFSNYIGRGRDGSMLHTSGEITYYGLFNPKEDESHMLYSYNEDYSAFPINQGYERNIIFSDENDCLTQYNASGIKQEIVFKPFSGTFGSKFIDTNTYHVEYKNIDGKYQIIYVDLEGNELKRSEQVVTTYNSFDEAFDKFNNKFASFRKIIDARIEELKLKNNK